MWILFCKPDEASKKMFRRRVSHDFNEAAVKMT